MFSFGRQHVERIEKVRDTIILLLAHNKKTMPPHVNERLGDLVRECNELIASHVNLWPFGHGWRPPKFPTSRP